MKYLYKKWKQRQSQRIQKLLLDEWLMNFKRDDELRRKRERAERIKFFLDEQKNIETLQKMWKNRNVESIVKSQNSLN